MFPRTRETLRRRNFARLLAKNNMVGVVNRNMKISVFIINIINHIICIVIIVLLVMVVLVNLIIYFLK